MFLGLENGFFILKKVVNGLSMSIHESVLKDNIK